MTTEKFNELVEKLTEKVNKTLIRKQGEYNLDDDRLSFFKRACGMKNELPHQTLLGYTNKQIVSEFDMGMSNNKFNEDIWLEKVIDIICYQYLLYAVLKDTDQFKNKSIK